MKVSLIIPVLNEAECIGTLLAELPPEGADEVLVVDNGSTDDTAVIVRRAGVRVISEPCRGYGYACAAGAAAASGEVLVFMDGDGSFLPEQIASLVRAVAEGGVDLALGTRMRGGMVAGAMPRHQLYGNRLVARLVRSLYGVPLTDLGPFRAIRRSLLDRLDMRERTYGWPIEMIVKAARQGARIVELPVDYRPRFAGHSKVGGSLRGTLLATYRILSVTLRYGIRSL